MPEVGWLNNLDWQWPMLILLWPAPLLIRHLLSPVNASTAELRVPQFESMRAVAQQQMVHPARISSALVVLLVIWTCLLLAAARPVWFGQPEPIPTQGRDLMLAVDISDSMRVADIIDNEQTLTRLQSVKQVVANFVQARSNDRIGLILFGHQSFVQAPLTFDHKTVQIQLNEAMAGFAGSSTAIGDVLGMAIKSLRDRPSESRVLVLLTDGANTAGSDPRQAATIAKEAQIRIHTVGIGAAGQVIKDPSGESRRINASDELDVQLLQQIASTTGGQYFRAHDANEMAAVYQAIDKLEPSPEPQTFRPERSLFHWPLALAMFLTGLLFLARRTRWA